jgi:hypothetical protein
VKAVQALVKLGYEVWGEDGIVRYRYAGSNPPVEAMGHLQDVARNKPAAVAYLTARQLPSSRLYPWLQKRVLTPRGEGELWQVGVKTVGVVLDAEPDRVSFIRHEAVRPADGRV